jgi:protein PhnA
MTKIPDCPICGSQYTYEDNNLYVCPECSHEWSKDAPIEPVVEALVVKDAYGNILTDGDSVTVIKDIKVKGSSSVIKAGTKVKDIRLREPVNGHNIDAKVLGFGAMMLKSEIVKKCT